MKTKTQTKQRKQLREFEIATLDLKSEFDNILNEDMIDELAMAEIENLDE